MKTRHRTKHGGHTKRKRQPKYKKHHTVKGCLRRQTRRKFGGVTIPPFNFNLNVDHVVAKGWAHVTKLGSWFSKTDRLEQIIIFEEPKGPYSVTGNYVIARCAKTTACDNRTMEKERLVTSRFRVAGVNKEHEDFYEFETTTNQKYRIKPMMDNEQTDLRKFLMCFTQTSKNASYCTSAPAATPAATPAPVSVAAAEPKKEAQEALKTKLDKTFEPRGFVWNLSEFVSNLRWNLSDGYMMFVEKVVKVADPTCVASVENCRIHKILKLFIDQFVTEKTVLQQMQPQKQKHVAYTIEEANNTYDKYQQDPQSIRLSNLDSFISILVLSLSITKPRNLSDILNIMNETNFVKLLKLLKSMTPENIKHLIHRLSVIKDNGLKCMSDLVVKDKTFDTMLMELIELNKNPDDMAKLLHLCNTVTVNYNDVPMLITHNNFQLSTCSTMTKIMAILSKINIQYNNSLGDFLSKCKENQAPASAVTVPAPAVTALAVTAPASAVTAPAPEVTAPASAVTPMPLQISA